MTYPTMAGISTSLNALLASNFSDLGRLGQGVNGAFSATHPQTAEFKNQLGNLREGTTISARYDYRVGPNGQLVQTGTTITTREAQEREEQQRQRQAATQTDDRKQSFSDLAKPKAQLSPFDELALFAGQEDAAEPGAQTITIPNGAAEEDGTPIEVELLTPELGQNTAPAQSLAARWQQQVSNLYARNFNLGATAFPVIEFAA